MIERGLSCGSRSAVVRVVQVSQVTMCVLLLLVSGLGCLGRSPNVGHYMLGTEFDSEAGSPVSPSDVAVLVGPVSLPAYLNRAKMARLGSGGTVELDEFGRWLGGFEENFLRAISLGLARELGSVKVVAYPSSAPFAMDYRVRLHVDDLVLVRAQNVLQVRIRWALLSEKDKLAEKSKLAERGEAGGEASTRFFLLETRVPVEGTTNEALVRAHDQVLAQLTREIAREIRR